MGSKRKKPEWEIRVNFDGHVIAIYRVDWNTADRFAKSLGIELSGVHAVKWPFAIHKIGHKVELEQEALSNVFAPKLKVQEGERMIVLVGREEGRGCPEDWLDLDAAIRKVYEVTENDRPMKWNVAFAGPGTILSE
jgi:hypothetical protein